jgi:cytochrome b561
MRLRTAPAGSSNLQFVNVNEHKLDERGENRMDDTISVSRYGSVAKALHWFIAALLAAQFAIAWTMPDIHRGTNPQGLVSLHFSLGIVVLVAATLRLLWRLRNPVPLLSANVPLWQYRLAQAIHALLYAAILVLPLMGWANASSRGLPINFFGIVALPQMPHWPLGRAFGELHVLTAYALLALVSLHVIAALYHHFWLRDQVLLRMLPGGGRFD